MNGNAITEDSVGSVYQNISQLKLILKGKRVLITGATGLIGSALVNRLSLYGARTICPVRSLEKAQTIFDQGVFASIEWVETPLEGFLNGFSIDMDFIIHCASPTASKFFVERPVETMLFNTGTTTSLLEYCRRHCIKGMVYLSSLESYGTVLDDSKAITEDFQGYVNPFEVRSSYNMAKRICESLCCAYAKEYGVPVKVVRLTQTISPHINDSDMRVFAQFARHAARGEDIELHTEGNSARQYIYIDDAVDAILCVLYWGLNGDVYNAAREDSYISVYDMAKFVQENFNPSGRVVFRPRDDMGYAPTTKLKLSTEKLRKLGWEAKYSLYDMFESVISKK